MTCIHITITSTMLAVPRQSLTPSPIQVLHIRSDCKALYLLHHLPRLPHPHHRQNLQDRSDCLRLHLTSSQMLFKAFWLLIMPFQHFSYRPAVG